MSSPILYPLGAVTPTTCSPHNQNVSRTASRGCSQTVLAVVVVVVVVVVIIIIIIINYRKSVTKVYTVVLQHQAGHVSALDALRQSA